MPLLMFHFYQVTDKELSFLNSLQISLLQERSQQLNIPPGTPFVKWLLKIGLKRRLYLSDSPSLYRIHSFLFQMTFVKGIGLKSH